MAITHRIALILLLTCLSTSSGFAQTTADAARSINAIKRDTTYIYAEATTGNADSAVYNAKAILEVKVDEWVRQQHPSEGIEVCIAKAKQHTFEVRTHRGNLQRAFVYVRKGDILPITDRSEVVVFQVTPDSETEAQAHSQTVVPADVVSEDAPQPKEAPIPVIVLTPEEKKMLSVTNLSGLNTYVTGLRNQQRLNGYGKYSTMPKDAECHVFVCDKQGIVLARLRHQADGSLFNLATLKPDAMENYNAGAIWFQAK